MIHAVAALLTANTLDNQRNCRR